MAEVPRLGLSRYALLGSRDEDVTGALGRALRDRPFRRLGRILLLEVSCYGRRVVSHRGKALAAAPVRLAPGSLRSPGGGVMAWLTQGPIATAPVTSANPASAC